MTRALWKTAPVLGVIAGHDQRDGTCAPRQWTTTLRPLAARALKGCTAGEHTKEFLARALPQVRAVDIKAYEHSQGPRRRAGK